MRAWWLILALAATAQAGELPPFQKDEEADAWLRSTSSLYAEMARAVDARGGCHFMSEPAFHRSGDVHFEDGRRCIALAADLAEPERVSVLIFEMTNAWQEPAHQRIDERARNGTIQEPVQFGMLHELIEYDGLRFHPRVLAELDVALGGLPAGMLAWIDPRFKTLADYELPLAFAYMEAQAKSGHTAHYLKWFWRQKGVPEPVASPAP